MTGGRDWSTLAVIGLLVMGCSGPANPPVSGKSAPPPASVSGDVNNGKQLFQAKGCIACHVAPGVPGATGTIGPNLTGIGDPNKRAMLADGKPNTPDHLRSWIKDPQSLKPGTMMPNLNVSEREADDLVALLQTFR